MMPPVSKLFLPPQELASCCAAAIYRDTRQADLSDLDRMNYFPSTPLFAVLIQMDGSLHISTRLCSVADIRKCPPAPSVYVQAPQTTPTQSWSPGPIRAATIAFFPDAWAILGGTHNPNHIPEPLLQPLHAFEAARSIEDKWSAFCAALAPIWQSARAQARVSDWPGSHRVQDWTRHLALRMLQAGPGASLRAIERRYRQWTGQSQQTLNFHAKIEELHRLSVVSGHTSLAGLAADADYSDQSHMGRAMKRATGFTPAQYNTLIETAESFWCYRLLGERF